MSEWKEYKLSELAEIIPGYAFKGKDFGLIGNPVVKIGDINPPIVDIENCLRIPSEKLVGLDKFKLIKGDFVVAMTGATLGKVGRYSSEKISFINQRVAKFENKPGVSDKKFLYYLITSREVTNEIINRGLGSAQPNISARDIESINVVAPNLYTQSSIAEILSSLDDKIELNNKINQELESLAQLLFKRWFVDFEFPNENGEPYKSSGGEMVDSELGEIPKGWEIKKLNDIANCYDNKRIPLSSMERAKRKGIYPYYGAASLMDFVDDFIFDGTYVLMGEDGSVINESGFPILQYVYGKFWVNNHAHVLEGKLVSTEFILCLLRSTNISDLVTGAVQPKLNQGNMNKISIALPKDLSEISEIEDSLNHFYQLIRNNLSEIINLTSLRDFLLPKLISGELLINEN
jgi:type I restriction enzyme S subunit